MKIGIITYYSLNNYGTALQAIALKKVLDRFGTVKLINYRTYQNKTVFYDVLADDLKWTQSYITFSLLTQDKKIDKVLAPLSRISKFRQFIKKHGNLTVPVCTKDLIENKLEDFDVYVSGSDQIWNPKCTNLDSVFFSDYAPRGKKKFSYASSTGGYIFNENQKNLLNKYLMSFSHISVREEQSAQMLKEVLRRDISHVLDPTLLLNNEEWLSLTTKAKKFQPYVLVYNMSMNSTLFLVAKYIAKVYNLDVYYLCDWYCINNRIDNKYFDKYFFDAGPTDFLELFYNASYIVTDSFHGTAFSINFNKQFISIHPKSGVERITSVLKTFGLEERLVANYDEATMITSDIDYNQVNKLLLEERQKSMNYIVKALGINENLEDSR